MNRVERRRQAKQDEKLLVRGIDPESQDPEPTAALARHLYALFERAKQDRDIDLPVRYLHSKVDATLRGLRDIPVACKKGCSHCCHIWVSATAPEVLFIAKLLRRRGNPAAGDKIKAANLHTKDFEFDVRDQHPHPCPLLEDDTCSIYESRPAACRLAASADAEICARSYHNLTNEDIPTPFMHLLARSAYAVAFAIAMKHAQLPYQSYEFNAALTRAMERADAERAWLAGEDVFSGVMREPNDPFSEAPTQLMYNHAFG